MAVWPSHGKFMKNDVSDDFLSSQFAVVMRCVFYIFIEWSLRCCGTIKFFIRNT